MIFTEVRFGALWLDQAHNLKGHSGEYQNMASSHLQLDSLLKASLDKVKMLSINRVQDVLSHMRESLNKGGTGRR